MRNGSILFLCRVTQFLPPTTKLCSKMPLSGKYIGRVSVPRAITMATRALASLVQLLRQSRIHHRGTTTDAELLELFISQRDNDAFEVLVRRHGPMVLAVCRRILHNEADVEDCFQATFLVLVRRAASLRRRGLVGSWLYGVARNVALKARAMRNLRHRREKEAAAEKVRKPADHDQHLQELLDQELQALPDRYRAAIVLCDLEGLTIVAAAKELSCPQGTLKARLVRGRAMLAKRLTRQGLTLGTGAVAAALAQNLASASVPLPLVTSTVKAAGLVAAGQAAAGAIGAKVVGDTITDMPIGIIAGWYRYVKEGLLLPDAFPCRCQDDNFASVSSASFNNTTTRSVSGYPLPRRARERSICTGLVNFATIRVSPLSNILMRIAGAKSWKIDARTTACGTLSTAARSRFRHKRPCPKTTWCSACWT